ncbi:hypothetical protein [Photobacterium satsumensis]|uniref:hypothetical protein n=1 Tax=Photobacterium satsumensis TaxID=2910239 RepID=UPI003D0B1449
MKAIKYILVTLLISFSSFSFAAKPEPVLNQPIHEPIANQQLIKKITKAGLVRGWQVEKESRNKLIAKIHVRSHYVAVNITLNKDSYDITYHDSENMKYNADKDTIHRKYNGWVANLNRDIQKELLSN